MCCVHLESYELSDLLLNVLQATLALERSGIGPKEIDDAIARAYGRIPPSVELSRLHSEFCHALEEARRQLCQKGAEVACQVADSTPVVTHSISSRH